MKREETEVAFFAHHKSAVHPKGKIQHQQAFNDHVWGQLFLQVNIAFPGIFEGVDVEFWRPYEFAFLAQMPFQNGDGIVQ